MGELRDRIVCKVCLQSLSTKFDCKVCPQNILHFEYKIWGNLCSKFVYKSLSADLYALLLAPLSANFRYICPLFLLGSRVLDASQVPTNYENKLLLIDS